MAYPSSSTTLTALLARVRAELGTLDDAAFTDARLTDYLNEGQAWLLPDVTTKKVTTGTVLDAAVSITLPADYVRLIDLVPDTGDFLGAYVELDGLLRFADPTATRAGGYTLIYEGAYPVITTTCVLPDPGNEGLVAFAVWRVLERIVVNRDDFKRYSTQTGSNLVTPQDLQQLADLYQQRFSAVREVLAQRVAAAAAF